MARVQQAIKQPQPQPAGLRAAAGLTQQALADVMGVTLRTVQGWESGERGCKGAALHFLQLLAGQHEHYFLTVKNQRKI